MVFYSVVLCNPKDPLSLSECPKSIWCFYVRKILVFKFLVSILVTLEVMVFYSVVLGNPKDTQRPPLSLSECPKQCFVAKYMYL